jgi:hypothetical protein
VPAVVGLDGAALPLWLVICGPWSGSEGGQESLKRALGRRWAAACGLATRGCLLRTWMWIALIVAAGVGDSFLARLGGGTRMRATARGNDGG